MTNEEPEEEKSGWVMICGAVDNCELYLSGEIVDTLYMEDCQTIIAFSDGTVLSVYEGDDGGVMRIKRIEIGTAIYEHQTYEELKNADYASDLVALKSSNLRWAVAGEFFVRSKR